LAYLLTDLEKLKKRFEDRETPQSEAILSYLNSNDGIMKLVQTKYEMVKAYNVDPIQELEEVLSRTDESGSSPWLAAHLGLGRLYRDAGRLEEAEHAYQELARFPERVPEAIATLNTIRDSQ
jgi:hypothetical protein